MDVEQQQVDSKIVVGVDGSQQSRLALRWAGQLAGCLGGRIEAVMAWHFPASNAFGTPAAWDPERDAKRCLAETVDTAFDGSPPVGLSTVVRQGLPAKVLLDASSGARMLVVGSRGHGGFTGLLLGSVSSVVAEHAECPVLVVHPSSFPEFGPAEAPDQ